MRWIDQILRSLQPQSPAVSAPSTTPAGIKTEATSSASNPSVRLETTLLNFEKTVVGRNEHALLNPWTLAHAFEGTQVFGETGAGKTSGSGATIAAAFLREGFGGLVLTAKTTDAYDWVHPTRGFLAQAGIDAKDPNKVIVIGETLTPDNLPPAEDTPRPLDTSKTFSFLDYEFKKTGRGTFNLVQLFITALESGSQGNTGQEDAYWMDALRQLLTNAIELIILATGQVTLPEVHAVIQTAPQSREEARSSKWQTGQSLCWQMLEKAQNQIQERGDDARKNNDNDLLERHKADTRTFKQIVNYWLLDFAGLADRTRSVIVSTFTSKVTGLTRWPLFELFCTGTVGAAGFVDIVNETRQGKVVIINLPVKRYTELGRFAQVLIKTVWQRGIERHPDPRRPVFIWADEAQFFATREDMLFQTTARSSGCATVYLTQNICNYYAMMPGKDPKSATDALLGNLATKIFHANGDPTTNDWAERVFGKTVQHLSSTGQSVGGMKVSQSRSQQQSLLPIVPAVDFTQLRKGGLDKQVEAVIFQGGRLWQGPHSKHNSIRVTFTQGQ